MISTTLVPLVMETRPCRQRNEHKLEMQSKTRTYVWMRLRNYPWGCSRILGQCSPISSQSGPSCPPPSPRILSPYNRFRHSLPPKRTSSSKTPIARDKTPSCLPTEAPSVLHDGPWNPQPTRAGSCRYAPQHGGPRRPRQVCSIHNRKGWPRLHPLRESPWWQRWPMIQRQERRVW